jgi:hypothetical protein
MQDWLGLIFLSLFVLGIVIGLRVLATPRARSAQEFERNAAEGKTMLGASMNALQELMNPAAAKAKEVEMQMKDDRYSKKKREGKANDDRPQSCSLR